MTEPDPAPTPRSSRWRRRPSRRVFTIAGAVLVLLLVAAVAFAAGRHSGGRFGHHGHHGAMGHAAWGDGMGFGGGHGRMGRGGHDGMGPDGMGPGGMGPDGMGPGGMGPGGPMGPGGQPGAMGPGAMGPGAMGPGAMGPGAGMAPVLVGSVVSVTPGNPGSLVVAPDGGVPQVTVPTNERTRLRGVGNALAGLQPGQRVMVRQAEDHSARVITVPGARAMGTVTGLDGNRATLVRPDGLTEAVDLTDINPKPANGDMVMVTGVPADNGATLKAQGLRPLPKAS